MFQTAITNIYLSNAVVDYKQALDERVHFDNENFQGGRNVSFFCGSQSPIWEDALL